MSKWKEDIVDALESLGGSASYDEIYEFIQSSERDLPKTWKAVIRRNVQNFSSDSAGYKGRKDIFYSVEGIGSGVWGLRSYLKLTPKAIDFETDGVEEPERGYVTTYRILRDTNLARQLKVLYSHECQICNMTINLPSGERYSEAHHIIPLGSPHNGPDTPENIIVLCPNHHVMLDYGVIKLNAEIIVQKSGHKLSTQSINYHNQKIYSNEL
jgi:5-methylcytosine-specific restriction endonuclease McrA